MKNSIPDQGPVMVSEGEYGQSSWATSDRPAVDSGGLMGLLHCLMRGQWGLILYRIAWRFPVWMFRFNQASLMRSRIKTMPHRRNGQHVFSFAALDDLMEIAEITDQSVAELSRRLDGGSECLMTRDSGNQGQLINVQWMHVDSSYVRGLGLRIEIGPGSAYTFGSHTVVAQRMKGVFQTALNEIMKVLKERGVDSVYCLIERENTVSYGSHIRLGYEPVIRITHLVLFGLKVTMTRNCDTGKRRLRLFMSHPQDSFSI